MFDFLKPPTDNLYKFIALTGLLLLVVSVALPAYALYALEIKRLEAKREVNITKDEIENSKVMKLLVESAQQKMDAAKTAGEAANENLKLAQISKGTSSQRLKRLEEAKAEVQKALIHLQETTSDFSKKADEYFKQVTLVTRRTVDNEYQVEVMDSIALAAFYSKFLLFAGVSLGLTLSVFGFILWYRKVQVFEDRVLTKAAAEALSENQEEVVT